MVSEARARVSCCQLLTDTGWPLQPLEPRHSHGTDEGREELNYEQSLVCSPWCPSSLYSVCFVHHHTTQARGEPPWSLVRTKPQHAYVPSQKQHLLTKGCGSLFLPEKAGDCQGWEHSSWEPHWALAYISSPSGSLPFVPSHGCSSSLWHTPLPSWAFLSITMSWSWLLKITGVLGSIRGEAEVKLASEKKTTQEAAVG